MGSVGPTSQQLSGGGREAQHRDRASWVTGWRCWGDAAGSWPAALQWGRTQRTCGRGSGSTRLRGLEPGSGHGKWPTLVEKPSESKGTDKDGAAAPQSGLQMPGESTRACTGVLRVVPPALEAAWQELMWRRRCLGHRVDPRAGGPGHRKWKGQPVAGSPPTPLRSAGDPALRGHADRTRTGTPAVSVQQRRTAQDGGQSRGARRARPPGTPARHCASAQPWAAARREQGQLSTGLRGAHH